MKKFNFSITFFLYSLLVYIFYLIVFVFVKKNSYESGIYYFTPAFIFAFIKLFESGIRKMAAIAFFTVLPYIISLYLTVQGTLPGWEVSGFIPVMVLMSYLFKSSDKGSTPLKIIYINKIIWIYLCAVLFFSAIHFIKTGSIDKTLFLAVSIYSPAPIAVTTALFVNFIVSTAAVSIILNNLDFFNRGALIKRLVFDSDSFLTFPHLNLSGIETIKNVTTKEFLELVEKLNEKAAQSAEYSTDLKKNKLFSNTFEDGMTLAMAPLDVMIKNDKYSSTGIPLPEKNDDRSFVALARDGIIIGYYAIDKIKPSTNGSYLEVFEKTYGIKSIIINPKEPKLWKKCCDTAQSFDETELLETDIIITESCTSNRSATQAVWGGNNFNKGDLFIAKPFLSTLHNLIILSGSIKNRMIKGVIFCSFPFTLSLFANSFGLMIPQISAVSVLFSFVFTMIFVFYVKPSNKERRTKK